MERGIISSYVRGSSGGTISCSGGEEVRFNASYIIGKDRNNLKQGDHVWFEVENIQNCHVAINIRKS
jgi:cold shock CspA family protein